MRGKKASTKAQYGIVAVLLLVFVPPAFAACPVKAPPGLVTQGALTIGTMLSNPPQMFSQNGQPTGVEIDLSRAIAAKMCLEARFVNVTFAGLFPGLMARKFDYLSSGLGITPERQKTFDFVPYFLGGIQLVARADSGLFFKNENGLCGHSVATISGTTQAHALERANKDVCKPDRRIALRYYPSFNDAVIQLRKKSAEVAFIDWPFAAYVTHLFPELKLASPIIAGRPEVPRNQLGFAFRKEEKPVEAAVTQAIRELQKTGEYSKILDKWHLKDGDIRNKP